MKLIILTLLMAFGSLSWARSFEAITIPGAKCGNDNNYKVFISKLHEEKLLVEFMGGGACWDKTSCFDIPHTWIRPIPNIGVFSTLTSDNAKLNPYVNHSIIYFPYCTGDVHIGNHTAYYDGKKVSHVGSQNVLLTLKYLENEKIIKFSNFKDLTVWGGSAGAIAALVYAKQLGGLVNQDAKKTLIADSPGLHFGNKFWNKFTPKLRNDFSKAFKTVGLDINFSDGLIARQLRPSLEQYRNWNIGFLIATKDEIMSTLFGNISPWDHEKLVNGPEGLPAIASEFSNIKVWKKDTHMHTFLILGKSAQMVSEEGETATDFVRRLNLL